MKLLYATSISYPSPFANRKQVLAMAQAFAKILGSSFLLGVGGTKEPLPVPHVVLQGSKKSPLLAWRYARLARKEGFTHVLMREARLMFFFMLWARVLGVHTEVFFEAHELKKGFIANWGLLHAAGVVSITHGLASDLVQEFALSKERMLVAPDAVDVAMFAHPEPKEAARKRLGLPLDANIAGYIGKLDGWKGVETFLAAADKLPNVLPVLIGGPDAQASKLSALHPKARFLGYRPYEELPDNQAAFDVLVLPNTAREAISARHTSPLKLFTYMTSGVPIVASDLPSLREVLDESCAFFAAPDNPEAFAQSIASALSNKADALQRAREARARVERYTWSARAESMLAFMERSGRKSLFPQA